MLGGFITLGAPGATPSGGGGGAAGSPAPNIIDDEPKGSDMPPVVVSKQLSLFMKYVVEPVSSMRCEISLAAMWFSAWFCV